FSPGRPPCTARPNRATRHLFSSWLICCDAALSAASDDDWPVMAFSACGSSAEFQAPEMSGVARKLPWVGAIRPSSELAGNGWTSFRAGKRCVSRQYPPITFGEQRNCIRSQVSCGYLDLLAMLQNPYAPTVWPFTGPRG